MHTQGIDLETLHGVAAGHGVGVDGDEEVGLVAVGNGGPLMQCDEAVVLACIDDLHVGTVAFYQLAETQGHTEVDVFFL